MKMIYKQLAAEIAEERKVTYQLEDGELLNVVFNSLILELCGAYGYSHVNAHDKVQRLLIWSLPDKDEKSFA